MECACARVCASVNVVSSPDITYPSMMQDHRRAEPQTLAAASPDSRQSAPLSPFDTSYKHNNKTLS